MSTDLHNFRAWYVKTLDSLYPTRDAGIAVLMISMPLLERYLRRKNKIAQEAPLNQSAWDGLKTIFPSLPDPDTARQFWSVYRNGFSTKPLYL